MAADRPPHWSDEETTDPHVADARNFYKVEQWTKDWAHLQRFVWAGNSLDKANAAFDAAVKRRPAIWLTLRQRARLIKQWPNAGPTKMPTESEIAAVADFLKINVLDRGGKPLDDASAKLMAQLALQAAERAKSSA